MKALDLVLRTYDRLNARDFEGYGELLAEDALVTVEAGTLVGREAATQYSEDLCRHLPDLRFEFVDVVAEGPDTVLVEIVLTGAEPLVGTEAPDAADAASAPKSTWLLYHVVDSRIKFIRGRYGDRIEAPTATVGVPPLLLASQVLEEQRALRRIATLVAEGVEPMAVADAVTREVADLFGGVATIERTVQPGRPSVVIQAGTSAPNPPQVALIEVTTSGAAWGSLQLASWDLVPDDVAERVGQFAGLIGLALTGKEREAQLRESRARLVASTDEARRRIQRDLHDGAQQRLVHTVLSLKLAEQSIARGEDDALGLVREARSHAERALADLGDLVHGILPQALARGGLLAGLHALSADVPVPVRLPDELPRLAPALETTLYFVVAEVLTNVVKHAQATRVAIDADLGDRQIRLTIGDDGRGGAEVRPGGGLIGLEDRLAVHDGRLDVASPAGGGTVVDVIVPLK